MLACFLASFLVCFLAFWQPDSCFLNHEYSCTSYSFFCRSSSWCCTVLVCVSAWNSGSSLPCIVTRVVVSFLAIYVPNLLLWYLLVYLHFTCLLSCILVAYVLMVFFPAVWCSFFHVLLLFSYLPSYLITWTRLLLVLLVLVVACIWPCFVSCTFSSICLLP